uniref:Uncharacterized protein n=1 Tax=Trichogramma kaykai TaxID=54128 RepID=A0ABD2WFW8_9HYME
MHAFISETFQFYSFYLQYLFSSNDKKKSKCTIENLFSNSNNNKNKCKHVEVLNSYKLGHIIYVCVYEKATHSSRSTAELSERYEFCVRKQHGRVLCTNTYIQDEAETWRKLHCSGAYNSIVHNPLYIDRSLSARLCLSLAPFAVSYVYVRNIARVA